MLQIKEHADGFECFILRMKYYTHSPNIRQAFKDRRLAIGPAPYVTGASTTHKTVYCDDSRRRKKSSS